MVYKGDVLWDKESEEQSRSVALLPKQTVTKELWGEAWKYSLDEIANSDTVRFVCILPRSGTVIQQQIFE